MARTNGKREPQQSESSRPKAFQTGLTFVNIYLSKEQKIAADLWSTKEGIVDSTVSTLLEDGYTVSIAFNEQTHSFIATVIGKRCGEPNEGFAHSSHGGTWYEALVRALFKQAVLIKGSSIQEAGEQYATPLP